ncbi:MAG: hypothetical protein IKK32_07175 [Oscillospiraceae bacterium]|nr:hypothetical protein [Oscillospiraceae bacterium]
MRNKLDKAREVLSQKILEDFKTKITGDELCVGQNPENKYLVGKLLPVDNDSEKSSGSSDLEKSSGSSVFIESVGVDFYIDKNEIGNAEITVYPRGSFYYRVYPSLDQQRSDLLKKINYSLETPFENFDELIADYNANPSEYESKTADLLPVYKKIDICGPDVYEHFILSEWIDPDNTPDNHKKIQDFIEETQEKAKADSDYYRYKIKEKVKIKDLLSEETYREFIGNNSNEDAVLLQNWSVSVNMRIRPVKEKYLISVSLRNKSKSRDDDKSKSKSKDDDKSRIETLFNAGMDIKLSGAKYSPIEMNFFADDYKYDKTQQATGNNCSVVYDEENNIISTENLPTYVQKRLVTNDELAVCFEDLIEKPIETLRGIYKKMLEELENWKVYQKNTEPSLTDKAKKNLEDEIEEFDLEIRRFKLGIDVIENHVWAYDSFVLMNRTFKNTSKKYNTWRLFQIVFIVSMIPDIVACDKNCMTDDEKKHTTLELASLLYFPTGGGKTEAFLGVLVFNLFFDRFRGKKCGVTSILRYPLRLLSVQQVQRLANALAQAELLRREDGRINETEPFSLGYFVGDANTPNKIESKDAKKYLSMSLQEIDKERVLEICPFCRNETVHLCYDKDSHRLMHYCDNPECQANGPLPIYIVDQEIYRYLPSAIISTVDKLAIMGNNRNFRSILSGATHRCEKHGYTSTGICLADKKCNAKFFETIEMYDPAPTLFIQDELHLIRESLGTYASHYESFVNYFVKNVSPSERPIKVIGATATISSYETQVNHLYGKVPVRFPCASPFIDRNFYSYIDKEDTQRLILGYAPYGKAIINSVAYSLKYMREVVYSYLENPQKVLDIENIGITEKEEALEILKDYWIFLEYNNVKRDGNNVEGALETPVNVELKESGVTEFKTRRMTGDETFQDVREVLAEVENNPDVFDGVNLITATSMISHGVDADRFNIMFFYGIPGNVAEYIQAYSRTGRRYSSIVVDIIRPTRETDNSYLKNFIKFHEYKDILVEAVPINKWATKAIDHTLPGIFAGLILTKYDKDLQSDHDSLFLMKNIKKAICDGHLERETAKRELQISYGCCWEDGGTEIPVSIGNQYKEKIESFVDDIFWKIENTDWEKENVIDGFMSMGYYIMRSLRDTEDQLTIELLKSWRKKGD